MAPAKSARAKKFAAFEDKAVKGTRASSHFTEVNEHTILSDGVLQITTRKRIPRPRTKATVKQRRTWQGLNTMSMLGTSFSKDFCRGTRV